jgi:hypothetical protein|tara:strand:+ start:2036 stop:2509 length:474 start_codon:yes stop_codon:yes gene_type:complete
MKAKTIEGMKNELWERAFVNVGDDRERVIALAIHLGEYDFEEVESYIDMDYDVYTDEEADEAVREYIEETVWAFSPSFLQAHTGVDSDTIKQIQNTQLDSPNEVLTAMIKDFDHFVEDAVRCDGRGYFLAQYDHEENYVSFSNEEGKNVTYFIYRVD